jgi:hypothetical protein
MLVWIAVGMIVVGVLLLALTVLAVIGRIRPLAAAGHRLRRRAEEARALQTRLDTLRQSTLSLQNGVSEAAKRMARLRGE